jgi:FKBP-type peptidyl-prolyl cis-trans isomerase FkpA
MPVLRTTLSILPTLALALGLTACGDGGGTGTGSNEESPQNPEAAYALGLMAARSLEQMQLSPAERSQFEQGMRDYENRTPRVTLLSEIPRVQSFQTQRMNSAVERERTQAETFLKEALAESGAEQFESGIVFLWLKKAEGGKTPTQTDRAIVRAEGTLPDGLLFYSSETQGPLSVNMLGGIPCLTEALARMSTGSKARITCPPHTGYAASEKPLLIPPGSALRFEVELVEVRPAGGHGSR